jgi:membrane-bound inhibitor of C-type lysozyme
LTTRAFSAFVAFATALILTLAVCHASSGAIAVQKLIFKCDDTRKIEAIFYWNPDQVRLTLPDSVLLLPVRKSNEKFDFSDGHHRFYSAGKDAILTHLPSGRSTRCTR